MPSTYSTNLRFELIAPGEQTGTWGGTTNTNIGTLIEQAISGASSVVMTDTNLTLSANNGASDQARSMYLAITSSVPLTATRNVVCPAVPKMYVVRNATTGGRPINVTAGGTGALVPNGATLAVICDGTNVRVAVDTLPSYQPTFRNRIINGSFNVWQRGTSQTASGFGSDDRWSNAQLGSTKTASQQAFTLGQTDVPGNPTYFARTVVSSVAGAGNYVIKQQRIENVRTFAGQTATVSFWAKADASRPIAIDVLQRFGSGGGASSDVDGIGAQQFNLTTSWQQFTAAIAIPSITGKTLGTNAGDCVELTFWFDAGSSWNARTASLGQQSGTFDIAQVQFEVGSVATSFEVLPPPVELALCQRYYEVGIIRVYGYAGVIGAVVGASMNYKATKRVTPTVVFTNTFANNVPVAASLIDSTDIQMFSCIRLAAGVGATNSGDSWTADAEI